jgi:predicted amidohydrolase
MLRIGYYQFCPAFGEVEKNVGKVVQALGKVAADLIVLPELAFTGYYFRDRKEAVRWAEDPKSSSTVDRLTVLCRERNFYLATGFAEKQADRCYNSALLIGPKGLVHTYRKLHLFNEEKKWFDPGNKPLDVQTVRGTKIGMMICFDWIFPETARTLALRGAQILAHPSNLVLNYCQKAMITRCIENGIFAVTANRTGSDVRPHGALKFTGQSQIVAPKGILMHRAPAQRDQLFIADVDPGLARDKHMTGRNDLMADRREEFYL